MILTTRSSIQRARWCRFWHFPLILGSFRNIFGTFRVIWEHFGSFRNIFEPFRNIFGSFRVILDHLHHPTARPHALRSNWFQHDLQFWSNVFIDPTWSSFSIPYVLWRSCWIEEREVKIMLDRRASIQHDDLRSNTTFNPDLRSNRMTRHHRSMSKSERYLENLVIFRRSCQIQQTWSSILVWSSTSSYDLQFSSHHAVLDLRYHMILD